MVNKNQKDSETHFNENGKGQVEFGIALEGQIKCEEDEGRQKSTTNKKNMEKYKTHPKKDKWIYLRNHCGGQRAQRSGGQLYLGNVCQCVLQNM